jgi:hypothetical protein
MKAVRLIGPETKDFLRHRLMRSPVGIKVNLNNLKTFIYSLAAISCDKSGTAPISTALFPSSAAQT